MDRKERGVVRKQLLEAKRKGDLDVLNKEFQRLLHSQPIEWDLVTLILSSVTDNLIFQNSFYEWANQMTQVSSIPENACSCVLSICANFGNKEEAMKWIHRLQQEGIPLRNRHVAPLLRLAQKTNDSELVEVINKLVASSPLDINQKTRKESILYYGGKGDEQGVIRTLRDLMKTDHVVLDPSLISSLKQFCVLNTSWELEEMRISRNQCSCCHQLLTKQVLTEQERQKLCRSIETMVDTSYRRVQQFLQFQEDLKSIEPFDVVVDGANVGFMNANLRLKTGSPVSLSTNNIQLITDALKEREMKPLIVLHHYHLNHLQKQKDKGLTMLENLQKKNLLYLVREGSNDDWYWLYASLMSPIRMFVTNDQMRDHLFNAEEDDNLFRIFRDERQITYKIPPVARAASEVSFRFPRRYSMCIQETANGFHLPFGKMEKSAFKLEKWYCLRNRSVSIAQIMRKIH